MDRNMINLGHKQALCPFISAFWHVLLRFESRGPQVRLEAKFFTFYPHPSLWILGEECAKWLSQNEVNSSSLHVDVLDFRNVAPFRKPRASNVLGVENRGQISDFLIPIKNYRREGDISDSIFRATLRIQSLIYFWRGAVRPPLRKESGWLKNFRSKIESPSHCRRAALKHVVEFQLSGFVQQKWNDICSHQTPFMGSKFSLRMRGPTGRV